MSTRQKMQKLYFRLDRIIARFMAIRSRQCWIQDLQEVIRGLERVQAGCSSERWAEESFVLRGRPLVQRWHRLAMNPAL